LRDGAAKRLGFAGISNELQQATGLLSPGVAGLLQNRLGASLTTGS